MDTKLTEEQRAKLDGIVQNMIKNKESDSNIRFVVDDFKKKYGTYNQQQIQSTEQQSQPKEQSGFIDNLKNAFSGAFEKIKSGFQTTQQGAINKDISQGATEQARGALGMASGAIETAFALPNAVIQTGLQKTGLDKPIAQGVQSIADRIANVPSIQKFAMSNPNAEEVISDLINVIGTAYAPENLSKINTNITKPVFGEALSKTGKLLQTGTEEAIQKAKIGEVSKLLTPIETAKTRLENVSRTTEQGMLGSKVVQQTPKELEMVDIVSKIPEINVKKSAQSNYNVLRDYNISLAKDLEAKLKDNNFLIPRKETIARINSAVSELESSPVIVGDAQNTAMKLIDGAKKFVNESDGTASGLLEARKKYDNWVLSQKPKTFDANTENAFTIANRTVRNTLNTLLDEKAPNVQVKDALKTQSRIYDAMDVVQEKAAVEGKNKIERAIQRVGQAIGTKNPVYQKVASAGILAGGIGAATMALPTATGIAGLYALYRGGKWIVSPELRSSVGKLLEQYGTKLNPADKKILEQLSGKGLPKQGGFIKNPLAQDSLIQEAKKYKSAEEFIKAQKNKTVLTYKNLQENDYSKKILGNNFDEPVEYFRAGELKKNGDIWLTPNEAGAKQYSQAGGGTKINSFIVESTNPLIIDTFGGKLAKGNININKILTKEEINSGYTNNPEIKRKFIDYAKNNGYDSVQFSDSFPDGEAGMTSLVVWDKTKLKPKSQLEQIWKEANKK